MRRTLPLLLICSTLHVVALADTPAAAPDQATAALDLPAPDLSRLEAEVAGQLQAARDSLAALLSTGADPVETGQAWLALGRLYHAYELRAAAEDCYRTAIPLLAGEFEPRYYLARVLQENGGFTEAAEQYGQLAADFPDSPLIQVRLAEVQLELGQVEPAKSNLLLALYLQPGVAAILSRLGEIALQEGRHALAIQYLEAALTAHPEADRLHYMLGMAYRGLGDDAKARDHLAQRGMVGIQPPDPWSDALRELIRGERLYLQRGALAYRAGQFQEAEAAYRRALEANPESITARVNLGVMLYQQGDLAGAIGLFSEVLAVQPDNRVARFNLGRLRLLQGDAAAAARELAQAVAADPKDLEAQWLLALALEGSGQPDAAMDAYQAVVRLDPTREEAWIRGTQLLVNQGRFDDAVGVLRQALQKLPDNGRIAHALARLLAAAPAAEIRDGAAAVPLAQQGFDAAATPARAATLAAAYAESGNCEEAALWQQQAIDLLSAPDTKQRQPLEADLQRYRRGGDCRPPLPSQ